MECRRRKNEENDRSEESGEHDSKIAVFTTMATTWINVNGLEIFAVKNGAQKVAFWGAKVALKGSKMAFWSVSDGFFTERSSILLF